MSERSKKLIELAKFTDLETGEFHKDAFTDMKLLYQKGRKYHRLCLRLRMCDRCEGLNIGRVSEVVCPWGNLNADIMFVGQSGHEPGMYSQLPFILGSGLMLDAALKLSGLNRRDCFFSNAVHCHPERNRGSTKEEKENCWGYLEEEINIVQPKIIVSLGRDAKIATAKYKDKYGKKEIKWLNYAHPASLIYSQPEARPNFIVKLSLDLDKALKK